MKNKILTTGSVITVLLSSLCCIGPLILIGFGIGSTALFSQFYELRPYLIAAAIIFLIPAFYLVSLKINKESLIRFLTDEGFQSTEIK